MSRSSSVEERFRELETERIRFIEDAPWDPVTGLSSGASALADDAFSELALGSFRFQCESIPDYGAFARHLGRGPDQIRHWTEIPPVPSSAFKSHDLSAGGAEVVFETSGTTISEPGRIRLGSTRLYNASLQRNFARHLLPDGARHPEVVFGPRFAEANRSSLWFMVERVVAARGAGGAWVVRLGEPRWDLADESLARAATEGRPLLLIGTTLLFMAYFAHCDAKRIRFALPAGSRAMDTGGSKGQRVEINRENAAAAFARVLAIPPTHLVNEYGMAELGSQFYQDNLLAVHEGREARLDYEVPPWVRTRVLDPETMLERRACVPGVLVHYDLANLEVPLAIQTEDVGALADGRLSLEGRLPEAECRGCSLPFEQFLERERSPERKR